MKIVVVGTGYVGLSNAVMFALKHEVIAIDINENVVDCINKRKAHFYDPDIIDFYKNKDLNLKAYVNGSKHYKDADIIFIATPTNYDPNKNYFDTSSVETTINDILSVNKNAKIVIKSTIPVGYCNSLVKKYNYTDIYFVPEFLKEGKALHDCLYPSRIIVGVYQKEEKYNDFAKKLISGDYGFLCQYDRKLNFDTVWSSIYSIKNKKIYIAEGNPSRKKFKEDKRLKFCTGARHIAFKYSLIS